MTVPPRWKPRSEYTVAEVLAELRANRAPGASTRDGGNFHLESDDYRRYRVDALAAAGLTEEAAEQDPDRQVDPASWGPEEHLQAIRRRA